MERDDSDGDATVGAKRKHVGTEKQKTRKRRKRDEDGMLTERNRPSAVSGDGTVAVAAVAAESTARTRKETLPRAFRDALRASANARIDMVRLRTAAVASRFSHSTNSQSLERVIQSVRAYSVFLAALNDATQRIEAGRVALSGAAATDPIASLVNTTLATVIRSIQELRPALLDVSASARDTGNALARTLERFRAFEQRQVEVEMMFLRLNCEMGDSAARTRTLKSVAALRSSRGATLERTTGLWGGVAAVGGTAPSDDTMLFAARPISIPRNPYDSADANVSARKRSTSQRTSDTVGNTDFK